MLWFTNLQSMWEQMLCQAVTVVKLFFGLDLVNFKFIRLNWQDDWGVKFVESSFRRINW